MKRPRLQRSLQKYLKYESKKATTSTTISSRQAQKDTRIVWHRWSDGKHTRTPFREGSVVLVLGDGDFSFSRALLETPLPGGQIIATVWDNERTVREKYPSASCNIEKLLEAGATVLFSVDATRLNGKYLAGKMGKNHNMITRINRIIFNFPHTGEGIKDREYNIRAQQKLILEFLRAARLLLAEQLGSLIEGNAYLSRKTIMATPRLEEEKNVKRDGNGDEGEEEEEEEYHHEEYHHEEYHHSSEGLDLQQPEIHLTSWTGDPYDDWQIKKLATSVEGLLLLESYSFDCSRYAGYRHKRTIGNVNEDVAFTNRPARTFVFTVKNK